MRVESERLWLYPITDDEMRALAGSEPDPELRQAYREMYEGCLGEPDRRLWHVLWYMELKREPGVVVGDLGFKGLAADGMVEIGYGLREGWCGRGYMGEAVAALASWALAQPHVTRVEAETAPDNVASQRVLARVGFEASGETGEEGPRYVFRPLAR